MLVIGFPAAAFGTNCYVVAPAAGQECLVLDPGIGVLDRLSQVLAEHGLRPAAVLATHGHLDHVYSVTPVCQAHGVAVAVHADDRYRLVDPVSTLGPELREMFVQQFGRSGWHEPDDVLELAGGQRLSIAGIDLEVLHAPGHTEGSVIFTVAGVPTFVPTGSDLRATAFAGDVLFAGSIGRTDLAGGDPVAMWASLRDRVLTMDDATLVLPGHGPATTIGAERAGNPYLREDSFR